MKNIKELLEAVRIADAYLTGGKEWTFSEYEFVRDRLNKALKEFDIQNVSDEEQE